MANGADVADDVAGVEEGAEGFLIGRRGTKTNNLEIIEHNTKLSPLDIGLVHSTRRPLIHITPSQCQRDNTNLRIILCNSFSKSKSSPWPTASVESVSAEVGLGRAVRDCSVIVLLSCATPVGSKWSTLTRDAVEPLRPRPGAPNDTGGGCGECGCTAL